MKDTEDTVSPIVIVVPVFNDWEVVGELLRRIDQDLATHRIDAAVILVDDGSTSRPQDAFSCPQLEAIRRVTLIGLRRNLGHQRAIAVALSYVHEHLDFRAVLIMDGDGEDDPKDIRKLVASFDAHQGRKIVFAARARRSESWVFRFFYGLYQLIHRVLTGYRIRVGNLQYRPASRVVAVGRQLRDLESLRRRGLQFEARVRNRRD